MAPDGQTGEMREVVELHITPPVVDAPASSAQSFLTLWLACTSWHRATNDVSCASESEVHSRLPTSDSCTAVSSDGTSDDMSIWATTVWEKPQNTKYLPGDFIAISSMLRFAFSRPSTRSSQRAFLSMAPERISNLRVRSTDTWSSPHASFWMSFRVPSEGDVRDIAVAPDRRSLLSYSGNAAGSVTVVTLGTQFLKARCGLACFGV